MLRKNNYMNNGQYSQTCVYVATTLGTSKKWSLFNDGCYWECWYDNFIFLIIFVSTKIGSYWEVVDTTGLTVYIVN